MEVFVFVRSVSNGLGAREGGRETYRRKPNRCNGQGRDEVMVRVSEGEGQAGEITTDKYRSRSCPRS